MAKECTTAQIEDNKIENEPEPEPRRPEPDLPDEPAIMPTRNADLYQEINALYNGVQINKEEGLSATVSDSESEYGSQQDTSYTSSEYDYETASSAESFYETDRESVSSSAHSEYDYEAVSNSGDSYHTEEQVEIIGRMPAPIGMEDPSNPEVGAFMARGGMPPEEILVDTAQAFVINDAELVYEPLELEVEAWGQGAANDEIIQADYELVGPVNIPTAELRNGFLQKIFDGVNPKVKKADWVEVVSPDETSNIQENSSQRDR